MTLQYEIRKEKNRTVVDMELPPNSKKIEAPFLEREPKELNTRKADRLLVELKEASNLEEQLKEGVVIDGKHYSLFKPSQSLIQPIKPPEKSSPKEPAKIQKCPECKSTRIVTDYELGEEACQDCGYVLSAKVTDSGPEWRAFDQEQRDKRTRVGAPQTYTIHDKGLSTTIDWHDRDVYGKGFSPGQKAQMYRLRKWNRRIRVSDVTERNLSQALSEITRTSNNLNLPKSVIETGSVIYRKAVKERLIRGRSINGVTAAAIYLACRQCGLSRSLEEVAQASRVNKKEVARSYRFLVKELNYSIPPQKPSQYITKFSNQLTMPGKVEEIAYKILGAAKEIKLTSGRGPTGMAAAASYIASVLTGDRKTQREIAEAAQVTEVTIRNRYKELVKELMYNITL